MKKDKVKYTYIALLVYLFANSCTHKRQYQQSQDIGIEINKKLIVSKDGDILIYSSNYYNYYRPAILSGLHSVNGIKRTQLNLPDANLDYLAQAISHDNTQISIVSENKSNSLYDLYLYNIKDEILKKIKTDEGSDNGTSSFSPRQSLLAFLSTGILKIYDFKNNFYWTISGPSGYLFSSITWSAQGRYIYMDDTQHNIWRFDTKTKLFIKVRKAPSITYTTNSLVAPEKEDEKSFYFVSDSSSNFNQIYKYNSNGEIIPILISNQDKYLLQNPVAGGNVFYRSNINGYYILHKFSKKKNEIIYPEHGVVYDFYEDTLFGNLTIFADNSTPASIFKIKNGFLENLMPEILIGAEVNQQSIVNSEGMFQILLIPKTTPKGWIVWLHGGPHEQVSHRYNIYFAKLIEAGYGVIALNYPGSTGLGNNYELQGMDMEQVLNKQVEQITIDIDKIQKAYPFINEYSIVGVSYGSLLAHAFAKKTKKATKIIDLSGLYDGDSENDVPILYLFGQHDFSLQNSWRKKLLLHESKNKYAKIVIIKGEGHVINHKKNMKQLISSIIDFLND